MPDFLVALAMAVILAFGITPLIRHIAQRVGALDRPVARSVHTQATPYLGGLAIFLAFSIVAVSFLGVHNRPLQGILLGGAVIVALGIFDDIFVIRPLWKLLGQIAASGILIWFDVRIEWIKNPFGGLIMLDTLAVPLSIPVTLFWMVAFINMMNLVDGLDGLAAGISSIASITLLFSALQTNQSTMAVLLSAVLAGSALGFLPYNFNPAKIFMGDGGAMFLGYILGAVSVEGMLKSTAAIAFLVPVLAMGLPIFDTAYAIFRRWKNGVPFHQADKEHLHHRLLRLGLSHKDAVLVMYFISGWFGISALAINGGNSLQAGFILLFISLSVYVITRRMGIFDAGERNLKS